MAYSELVKNFSRIRDYIREFYVYGFKSRDEFTGKSGRTYDDERRRVASWLGDYMQFRQTADGKNLFLSIDTRRSSHNPLYTAWKTKSFTDGDITLHFILMDILSRASDPLPLGRITEEIDTYLSSFATPKFFDESTVRKKLNEYRGEGIVVGKKNGKTMVYQLAESGGAFGLGSETDTLHFFSEVAPCGVVGSFLLDKFEKFEKPKRPDKAELRRDCLAFKHHYITCAMDSEILYTIFLAMGEKRFVALRLINRAKNRVSEIDVVPLKVMASVQSGRQYLMAYRTRSRRITSFRLDKVLSVATGEVCAEFDQYRLKLESARKNIWGVSTDSLSGQRLERVEFTLRYGDDEQFVHRRLEREKRCGQVERLDANSSRFSAEVFDTSEMIPWIRTFIGRITDLHFSNRPLEIQFREDIKKMYELYNLGGGGGT